MAAIMLDDIFLQIGPCVYIRGSSGKGYLQDRWPSDVRNLGAIDCVVPTKGLGKQHCPLASSQRKYRFYYQIQNVGFLALIQVL